MAKLLETNPNTNKKLIIDAASYWKVKMEPVQDLIEEIRENIKVDESQRRLKIKIVIRQKKNMMMMWMQIQILQTGGNSIYIL